EILQAKPYLGRLFRSEDMQPGHNQAVILTYTLWHSLFRADPAVVGKSTIINSAPYTILGVLPRKVAKIGDEQLYVPLVFEPPLATDRTMRYITTVGRLSPKLGLAAAQSRISALS